MRHSLVSTVACMVLVALVPSARAGAQMEILDCEAERPRPLVPEDPALCETLHEAVRRPSALPLSEYEEKLGEFLRRFCHRAVDAGWQRDRYVRDTGPFISTLGGSTGHQNWQGKYHGLHAPVVIWYSPDMYDWMRENRPLDEDDAPAATRPVPDGAIMVKEMFPPPGASCREIDPSKLLPTLGAAVMVRDSEGSKDGWFWGSFGWPEAGWWQVDWPAAPSNNLPFMGFGQYCLNCHASAPDFTFASMENVDGTPLVFLSQHFYDAEAPASHHRLVTLPQDDALRLGEPSYAYNKDFTDVFPGTRGPAPRPTWDSVSKMPSETYDNVWMSPDGPTAGNEFLTSDQCVGCHDAGSTGLQFDMTVPNPHGDNLLNLSPYGTWRTSPMGLGGRDPIFFAQLASEGQSLHPGEGMAEMIQNVCLGCHGILGQRQHAIDRGCEQGFLREYANAAPYPPDNPLADLADYGALARDGISCTACHHMLVGEAGDPATLARPENRCVKQRQDLLNPDNSGFARTFTGSFVVGPPQELYGPFEDPKTLPMEQSLGITPTWDRKLESSELCGTCHTVHLPVYAHDATAGDEPIAYTYEQTTYPEWAFSAYRTGKRADGTDLPGDAGDRQTSCQGCHMPSEDDRGRPYRSKIASIQERSNMPQVEHGHPGDEIDLEVREGFARHDLVGLNVFFVKMAQQFPDVLGIRTQDPMMVTRGLDPLLYTEQAMLDQASEGTAQIRLGTPSLQKDRLTTEVTVTSAVGHKFPSGVGFRRAFIEFQVLGRGGDVLWASGATNGAGVIVDEKGEPLAGELWWASDCSRRTNIEWPPPHQPHFTTIRRQTQAQIYQELVVTPPLDATQGSEIQCGLDFSPGGRLTTSFLSICGHIKDNRLLPHGFLSEKERMEIAEALGAGEDLARDSGPGPVAERDPDYRHGGQDTLTYAIDLDDIPGEPAAVRATLYYQAIPPFYLQDRFCTARGADADRLYFLAGHLNLDGTEAAGWKLEVASSGTVDVP